MEGKRNVPVKYNLLPRPKVNALLEKGLECSLITVVAGPGYGKTQAVASFVQNLDKRVMWLLLSTLDNNETRFWETFTACMEEDLPELANELAQFGFPESIVRMDAFLRIFTKALYAGKQLILAVDDFYKIENARIKNFFTSLVDARLENFTLIIISAEKSDLNVSGLRHDGDLCSITMEDLRFSQEEAKQLFAQSDILLSDDEAEQLVKNTEGWPLALHLLTTHHRGKKSSIFQAEAIMPLYAELFENDYFIGFPEGVQKLFIKLSQFEYFYPEIVRPIGGCDLEEAIQVLSFHMFLQFNHVTGQFVFHKMYREFLQKKQFLIPAEELRRVTLIAAECFRKHRKMLEAVACYRSSGEYLEMWKTMMDFPGQRKSRGDADFFIDCIQLLPKEERDKPEVIYYVGLLHLNNAEVNKALSIFLSLVDKMEGDEKTKNSPLLGEVYSTLGDVSIIKNTLEFYEYYQKAHALLPNGSSIRHKDLMFIENNNSFYLPDHSPGALKNVVQLVFDSIPYVEAISNGSGYGFEYLFAAEAALACYELEKAKDMAYHAIHKASVHAQHDIICNSYYLLIRLAFLYGDYPQAAELFETVKYYIESRNLSVLFEMRDSIASWYYFSLGDSSRGSKWLLEKDYGKSEMTISSGRDKLFYANYFMSSGDYIQALAILNNSEELFLEKGLWLNRVSLLIIKAECRYRNSDRSGAIESFRQAYDMTYHNNIIAPFVMLGNTMRSIIDMVRKAEDDYFDQEFLNNIYHKASAYAKRFASVVKEYNKQHNKAEPEVLKPTKRELEVLGYLAQGLTREEIGDIMKISINGVKKHITGIYNKLGAINRADAVHIALSKGYIR